MTPLFTKEAFTPPSFAHRLTRPPPPSRVLLGLLPTPLIRGACLGRQA